MAINGIELEVGQKWLTRGGQTVKVVNGPIDGLWPFIVRRDAEVRYSVDWAGFAMSSDCPRDTDLVQPVELDIDLPLQATAEPQDTDTVTSAQVNDWIDWHGGDCPVGPSTPIEIRIRGGSGGPTEQPGEMRWSHTGTGGDIVAYRVVKPTLFHERVYVDGTFPTTAEPLRVVEGVGDINSDAKGSGARFNTGKPALELIPLSIIVPFYSKPFADAAPSEQAIARALNALDALGMFQAREGSVYDVLRELGDHWDGCARVFDFGRRKYAEWNWAKGMAWSIPIACAARHLMAIIRGETHDPESSYLHADHVYCNVVMLLTYAGTFTQGDDRPAKGMLL